jgi:exodeoxyribonuclease-1
MINQSITPTYLFYDIETSGLNKVFDQVLQFAAIRTDKAFNELERHNFLVKLRPDIIPSPKATITHRITIAQSMQQDISEYEAIQKIHQLFNYPGTISLGYNTLKFDDQLLRFSFHRNLLRPYTHQYKNECRRMDLLPITNMYYLYKKEVLNWPMIENKPSLKLEHLNEANQLATGQAHDALVDVQATVELARRLAQIDKMWEFIQLYFDKSIDEKRIQEIPISFQSIACSNRIALMIDNEYGSTNQYQIPVLFIGDSIPYKNQTLWLRLDLPKLREITAATISKPTWLVIRKKYGELGLILPPEKRRWDYLSPERQAIVAENQEWLQSHTQLFHQIIQHHREYTYPKIPDLDVEAALYQNDFLSKLENNLCQRFHSAELVEKIRLIPQFDNIGLRQLASRLLCRNYPVEQLPPMLTLDFQDYMRRVNPENEEEAMIDYKSQKRTTPRAALAEITKLRKGESEEGKLKEPLDQQQQELLTELEDYLQKTYSTTEIA